MCQSSEWNHLHPRTPSETQLEEAAWSKSICCCMKTDFWDVHLLCLTFCYVLFFFKSVDFNPLHPNGLPSSTRFFSHQKLHANVQNLVVLMLDDGGIHTRRTQWDTYTRFIMFSFTETSTGVWCPDLCWRAVTLLECIREQSLIFTSLAIH